RKDGVIVKPDVPLTPIDASYLNLAHSVDAPQIDSAWSDSGSVRTHYVFAYPQGNNATARFTPADFGAPGQVYLYDYFAGTGQVAEPAEVVEKAITGDALYVIAAPVGRSGIALLGDLDQFVPMGRKRVSEYSDDGRVHLKVAFAAGETERKIQ